MDFWQHTTASQRKQKLWIKITNPTFCFYSSNHSQLPKPEAIHIIHNFKKIFGGILRLSPCCLHFVHIVFLFVHTYILELITLFDQFSPQNIVFYPPIHKVIHIIHKSIHSVHQGFIQELSPILSTFSPDSKLYFFLRVCYSILRIIKTQDDNQ